MKRIKPLHHFIIVKPLLAETTWKGIIIPDSAQGKRFEGEVISVGDGRISPMGVVTPLAVKPGDHIIYNEFSGHKFEVMENGVKVEYIQMREDEVTAIIEDEDVIEPVTAPSFKANNEPEY